LFKYNLSTSELIDDISINLTWLVSTREVSGSGEGLFEGGEVSNRESHFLCFSFLFLKDFDNNLFNILYIFIKRSYHELNHAVQKRDMPLESKNNIFQGLPLPKQKKDMQFLLPSQIKIKNRNLKFDPPPPPLLLLFQFLLIFLLSPPPFDSYISL